LAHDASITTAFLTDPCNKRYGKLKEEFANDFSKGVDKYPRDIVKEFNILNEYQCYNPPTPSASGIAFTQKTENQFKNKNIDTTKEEVKCWDCGHPGVTKFDCPKCSAKSNSSNNTNTNSNRYKNLVLKI